MKRRQAFAAGLILLLMPSVPSAAIQPVAKVQEWVLQQFTEYVAEKTPYQLTIGSVEGNLLTQVTLRNLRISAEGMKDDFFKAERVTLSMDWPALLQRRVEIKELRIEDAKAFLELDENNRLILPQTPERPKKKEVTPFKIERLKIDRGGALVTSTAANPPGRLQLTDITLDAHVALPDISLTRLSMALAGGRVSGTGQVHLAPNRSARFTVATQNVPLHELMKLRSKPPKPLHLDHSGQWTLRWTPNDMDFSSRGELEEAAMTVEGERKANGLMKMKIDLSPVRAHRVWRVENLSQAGQVSAQLQLELPKSSLASADVKGSLQLVRRARTRDEAVAMARVQINNGKGPVVVLLQTQGLAASATAQLNMAAQSMDSKFSLAISSFMGVAEWVPEALDMAGDLDAKGSLSGLFKDLHVDAQGKGKDLYFKGKGLEELKWTIKGGLARGRPFKATAGAKKFSLMFDEESPWDTESLELVVEGSKPQWSLKAESKFRNATKWAYKGRLAQEPKGWRALWDSFQLSPPDGRVLETKESGNAFWASNGGIEVRNLKMEDGSGSLTLSLLKLSPETIDVQGMAQGLAFGPWMRAANPQRKGDAFLDASMVLKGPRKGPEGTIEVKLTSGTMQGWGFKEVNLQALVEQPWVDIKRFVIRPGSTGHDVEGKGRLPWALVTTGVSKQPVDLTLNAPSIDPNILPAMVPGIALEKGASARLTFTAKGTYPADLEVKGECLAAFPRLHYKDAGLDFRHVDVHLVSTGREMEIKRFYGRTKKGEVMASGKMTLPELDIYFEAKNFDIDIPKRLKGRGSAKLKLAGEIKAPDLIGTLRVREATYTAPAKPKKKKEDGEDVRVQRVPSPVWEAATMNLRVLWERNVWYRDRLTKVETSGDLDVEKEAETTELSLRGQIGMVRGSYDAYGRDFIVESGDLVFTGGPEINPIMNVRAKYFGGGVDVYVDVKGRLKTPELRFSSNPPLPEQDIISVVIVGRPLNQIGPTQGDGTTRQQQAAALAGNVVGGYITRELRESGMNFGLDVVRVEPTVLGSRLKIGRYFGEKLFVSYGQPLQPTAGQIVEADYYLTRRWTVSAQSGSGPAEDTHLDLEFRYPLNGTDRKRRSTAPIPGSTTGLP